MLHKKSKLQAALPGGKQQENQRLSHENMTLKEVNVHRKNMVEQSKRLEKTENELTRGEEGRTIDCLKAALQYSDAILEKSLLQIMNCDIWRPASVICTPFTLYQILSLL